MNVQEIKGMGRQLKKFLSEFDDCFGRSEPPEHLRTYVQGRLSNLPRKSIEPIALSAKVAPRTLRRPCPQEHRQRGRKRRYPRLSRKALPACEVRNLLRYSPVFRRQKWQRFRIKDGEKGPILWEVKHACPTGKGLCEDSKHLGSIFANSSLVYRMIYEQVAL